jgi:hypothetical protein
MYLRSDAASKNAKGIDRDTKQGSGCEVPKNEAIITTLMAAIEIKGTAVFILS